MELSNIISFLEHQEATMELTRMGIVYAHLLACCVAIGMVIVSDVEMIKKLMSNDTGPTQDSHHLVQLKKTVMAALGLLWVTGFMIIGLDMTQKGLQYLDNPKLQAKVLVVALLTVNGFVLHSVVLPAMQKAGCILKLSPNQRTLAVFAGTVSAVSWLYAAMLGVGKPLSWKYSIAEIMMAYPLLIAVGFAATLLLIDWKKARNKAAESKRVTYAGILPVTAR